MADISIKGLPEQLYRRLRQSAKRNHRSLNKEAVYRIELGLMTPPERTPAEVREIFKAVRKLRRRQRAEGVWLTDEDIRKARDEGRP